MKAVWRGFITSVMEQVRTLYRKFTKDGNADPQSEQERLVRVVLVMTSLILLPLTVIMLVLFLFGIIAGTSLLQVLVVVITVGLCWWFVSWGHTKLAAYMLIGGIFSVAAVDSYLHGLISSILIAYPVVILLAALFGGERFSAQVLVTSILTYTFLGALHDQAPISVMAPPIIAFTVGLTSITLLQWYATRLLRKALAQANSVESLLRGEIAERNEMQTKLQHLSTHDALTGLYNRFFFEAELERLQGSRLFPVSVVMADVDGLKRVNDHYGHAAGDELLKRTAKLLKDSFRAEDVVSRIGGDEFAVLLPETDAAAMQVILPRLKSNLEKYNREFFDLAIELSIGMETGEKGSILTATMKKADDRMYEDKWGKKVDAWGSVEIK